MERTGETTQGEGTKQRKEKGSGERERGKKMEDVTEGGGGKHGTSPEI